MAKIDIIFNDITYSIEESAFAAAAAELKAHLLTTMSGTGATITLDGVSYNVDSTKLSTATSDFVTHLGKISGTGHKVMVGGVEYSVASNKVQGAISDIATVLGGMISGGNGGSVEGEVVIAEQTIQCEYMEVFYAAMLPAEGVKILPGDTCKVIWDGTEYVCECCYEISAVSIGNLAILGDVMGLELPNTGEPFLVSTDGSMIMVVANDAEAHTVSVHKIASKERSGENILEEKHYTFSYHEFPAFNAYITYCDIDSNFDNFELVAGETYHVAWDGKEYTCVVATDNVGGSCMGNYALVGAGDDTGEPFFIMFDNGRPICIANDGADKHLIGIYKVSSGNGGSAPSRDKLILAEQVLDGFEEQTNVANQPLYGKNLDTIRLSGGKVYKVIWDNEEYVVDSFKVNTTIAIGNHYIVSGVPEANTNEPFVIGNAEGGVQVYTSESGSHTISIYEVTDMIVFLEKAAWDGFAYDSTWGTYVQDVTLPYAPVIGKTYRVMWDGTAYDCIAQDASSIYSGLVALGNGTGFGLSGNGEPFAIGFDSSVASIFALGSTATTHIISIYGQKGVVNYDDTFPIEWNSDELYENADRARFAVTLDGQNLRFAKVSNLLLSAEELNSMKVTMSLGDESVTEGCYGIQAGDGYVLGQFTPNLAEYGTMVGCVTDIGDGSLFPETGIYAFYTNGVHGLNFSMQ